MRLCVHVAPCNIISRERERAINLLLLVVVVVVVIIVALSSSIRKVNGRVRVGVGTPESGPVLQ